MAAIFLCVCFEQAVAAAPLRGNGKRPVKPKLGRQVPDFRFTGFNGREYRLSNFSGHYVLLDFWATWCSLCLEEEPALRKAYKQLRGRGLVIIGLDSDKHAAKGAKYVRKHHIPWAQSAPQSTRQVIDHVLKIRWYPAIVVLDPAGKIVLVTGNGGRFLHGKKLLRALNRLLPAHTVAGRKASPTGN